MSQIANEGILFIESPVFFADSTHLGCICISKSRQINFSESVLVRYKCLFMAEEESVYRVDLYSIERENTEREQENIGNCASLLL